MKSPSRHLMWLGVAVVVPCAALVILTVRLLDQEIVLRSRGVQQAGERRLDEARRQLLADLEDYQRERKPVSFRGLIKDGRVILPWDRPAPHPKERAVLAEAVASGSPAFQQLARLPANVTDEMAIPIALYAIPRLDAPRRRQTLRRIAAEVFRDPYPYSPAALHLLRSLAAENRLAEVQPGAERLCLDAEAAERFQASYSRTAGADPSRWLSWGSPLYLVGFRPNVDDSQNFYAVASGLLNQKLSVAAGQALGEPFPGLRIALPPATSPGEGNTRPVLLAVLATSLALAGAGGFLLWRDYHRESQLQLLRTQFIAGVSHELRTPLTSIRMFIESLRMNPHLDIGTREEYLDTMQRESERLSRLVNNVLEFSRIEGQAKSYAPRPLSLQDTVQCAISAFRPVLDHAGYRVDTYFDPDIPEVQADSDALEQAVGNLLANAVKYSGASRRIEVKLRRLGNQAEIEVRDFGVGIPAGDHRHIFDPFYRVASRENKTIQGAGLGLTVVRHVMEGHGGAVLVESVPGKGSAFRLLLPL